jgi:RimJ/RimL family protein N-acetyltransferase
MSYDYSVTPTTADDIAAFFPRAAPWRVRALTAKVDGKIVGIGGYAILPNGERIGFMEVPEENCKAYPVVLYRATRKFFGELREAGVSKVTVYPDKTREAAVRWLEYLGFRHVGEAKGESFYVWQHSQQSPPLSA